MLFFNHLFVSLLEGRQPLCHKGCGVRKVSKKIWEGVRLDIKSVKKDTKGVKMNIYSAKSVKKDMKSVKLDMIEPRYGV